MAMIWVGPAPDKLEECPDPSSLGWGVQDISAQDAGRTEDTIMHKHRIGQKRKLTPGWMNKDPATTAKILQMFNPEYVFVRYHDAMLNALITKEFYTGDKTAAVKRWYSAQKRYESINFDLIER